jgi:hypothetical protein
MSAAVMHEIDLIPADYRHELGIKRTLRRVGLVLAALVAVAAVTTAALSQATSTARAEVAELNAAAASAEVERAAIDVLTRQKEALEAQAALRSGLRARAPLDELMVSIGRAAVDARVWFRSWRIERVGEVVPAAPAGAEAHFAVEPGSDGSRVRSEIVIVGRAADVGRVSAFAQALGTDGRFARLQVQRVARDASDDLVDFELALTAETALETP